MVVNGSYYEILEVETNASEQEIKRAYFKKFRQFPNETHPEEFQIITKAYKTLMDKEKRAEYDLSHQSEGDNFYEKLSERVSDEINRGDYNRALYLCEELEASYPHDPAVLFHKALILLNLERQEEAKQILLSLTSQFPNNENYHFQLARAYFELGMYRQSIKILTDLLTLNPQESEYYLRLSNAHLQLNELEEAMQILERKLLQDEEKIHDFPLLSELYFLTILADKRDYHLRIIERIKRLAKSDNERESLLHMLISECQSIGPNHQAYNELVGIIEDINNNRFPAVTDWLADAKSQVNELPEVDSNNYRATQQAEQKSRGSLLVTIIIGIVVTSLMSPFVGIPAAAFYYFYPQKIKNLIAGLGCLFVAIIVIALLIDFIV